VMLQDIRRTKEKINKVFVEQNFLVESYNKEGKISHISKREILSQ
jgi:uncharacterized protein (DUF2344 family)